MIKHSVTYEAPDQDAEIGLADIFNVAVAFIDRHLEEGKGSVTAIQLTSGEAITYSEVAANVNRCGNALLGLGLQQGDRILMCVTDCPMFIYTFWGAIKAGIIPIPVNTLMSAGEYRFLIDDSECAGVVYSPELTESIKSAAMIASHKPKQILVTEGEHSLWNHLVDAEVELIPVETSPESECFWLYSSGSTGNPKGVIHEHKDMVVTSVRFGQGIANISEGDLVYCTGKLFFSFGFGGGMTFPLWAGATTLLCDERTTTDLVINNIEKFQPSIFFCVPTLYAQILHATDAKTPDFSSIKRAISAGEALPVPVFERFLERFRISILDGIGSTEALHIFISNRINDIKPGTSGKGIPGYKHKILDDNYNEVPQGEIGTLWIKSASTARCYWKNPEKTAATMRNGWLNTGDMYYIDREGYYVNVGRGDDMLKVGGMFCSPIEVESCLLQHKLLKEVAVVGREDDDGLTKPEAYIVRKNGTINDDTLQQELHEMCKKHMAGYKYPRWYNFVNELPKTSTGKIQRFKLRYDSLQQGIQK